MTTTRPPAGVIPPPVTTRSRGSTRGYWLGGLVTAAAVVGAALWVVVAFFDYQHQIDRYPRITLPGAATVHVTDTSTRVLYYETTRDASTPTLSQFALAVTDATGAPLIVSAYTGDLRYDVPGVNTRIGRAVAQFHPTQAGTYQVRSTATGMTGRLAIGGDIAWSITPHIIGAAALFLVGGAAGVTLIVITGVRRANARREHSGGPS